MATDPITDVFVEEFETGFTNNLGATLRELAHLPPSLRAPYVTVYLDWRPDGERPATRSSRTVFEHEIGAIFNRYQGDQVARASLQRDRERIEHFLVDELEPAVHGVVLIACAEHNLFEPIVLALPIPTRISAGPTPNLLPLARIVEENPRYAILIADQHEARISIINRASRLQATYIEGDETPRKHKQGGWSQRRYQSRYEERVAHYARAVAEETRKALVEEQVDSLVVAGGEVITSALNSAFHPTVKKKIIGTISMDIRSSPQELIDATMPLVSAAERTREAAALRAWLDAVGSGDRGVAGPEAALSALQSGTVMKLLMAADFHAEGWADYGLNLFGTGPVPAAHPAGGNAESLYAIELEEEMVRLTVTTGAEGEIIPVNSAEQLAEFGGVGAILRY